MPFFCLEFYALSIIWRKHFSMCIWNVTYYGVIRREKIFALCIEWENYMLIQVIKCIRNIKIWFYCRFIGHFKEHKHIFTSRHLKAIPWKRPADENNGCLWRILNFDYGYISVQICCREHTTLIVLYWKENM